MTNKTISAILATFVALGLLFAGCSQDTSNPASVNAAQSTSAAFHKVVQVSGVSVTVSGHTTTVSWLDLTGTTTYTVTIQDSTTLDTIAVAAIAEPTLQASFSNLPPGSYFVIVGSNAGAPSDRVYFNVPVIVTEPPTVTASASPEILWPPKHKDVDVTFSGEVTNCEGGANYTLVDEYGRIGYSGSLAAGSYSLKLKLDASRKGKDRDGRTYTFTVTAANSAGSDTASVVVVVPHDKGHH